MKKILSTLILVFVGCGGSSQGTGGVTIEGKLLSTDGSAVQGVNVSVVGLGDAAVSDGQGDFAIETKLADSIELEFRDDRLDTTARLDNIPSNARRVSATFRVNRDRNEVRTERVESSDDEDDDGSGGSSGASGGTGDDGDDGDDDEDEDDDGSMGASGASGSSGGSSQGERVERRGFIISISSSAVVVGGVTFVPTAQTEYRNEDETSTTLSAFSVGDNVKARGNRGSSGEVLLERLEFED